MAILSGIAGLQMGDGAGGKIALSINTAILRILANMQLTYMSATIRNTSELSTGTVTYYKPEIVQTNAYGTGANPYGAANVATDSVNIDTRREARWTYEVFDESRLGNAQAIIGMISNGLAMAIQADLNATFINYINIRLTTDLIAQNLVLANLADTTGALPVDDYKKDINKLKIKIAQLSQVYNARQLGVEVSEIFTLFSPIAEQNIYNGFWNTNPAIEIILKGIPAKRIQNISWMVEGMLQNTIAAGTSFSKDNAINTTNLVGVVLHNEAIAFPINYNGFVSMRDPQTGNPLFLAKYQFGIKAIRPELIWGIVAKTPTAPNPITK